MKPITRFLFLILTMGLGAVLAAAGLAGQTGSRSARPPSQEMVRITGGTYTPMYVKAGSDETVNVEPFLLDRYPVTNAEYLEFVRANPSWQRSSVKPIFADAGYLQHWAGDLDFGPDSLAARPVVNVSWFAAAAYAEWKGKRLPGTAEWELAAAAGFDSPDGSEDPAHQQMILGWYSRPSPAQPAPVGGARSNYWGVHDLHGLVWEWVLDFNTAMATGDSRNNTDQDLKLFCGAASVGASQYGDYAAFIRNAYRSGLEASYTVANLGFRTAQDL